jgi:hypothetical protein
VKEKEKVKEEEKKGKKNRKRYRHRDRDTYRDKRKDQEGTIKIKINTSIPLNNYTFCVEFPVLQNFHEASRASSHEHFFVTVFLVQCIG